MQIKTIKLGDVAKYIHLTDSKSVKSWCCENGLDIHTKKQRNYVYEHELIAVIEYNYVSDTMIKHPGDYIERCAPHVSCSTIVKFSGCTVTDDTINTVDYGFSEEINDFLSEL